MIYFRPPRPGSMNDLVALGVLPGAAAFFGLVLGGPIGGFAGLFLGLVFGLVVLYAGSDAARVDELERRVEELEGELEEERSPERDAP